jgi:hypothetical protein
LTDIQRNILIVLKFCSTEKERPLIEAGIERFEKDHGSDLRFLKEIFMGKAFQSPKKGPTTLWDGLKTELGDSKKGG